ALEHARDRIRRGELQDRGQVERCEPARVVLDADPRHVQDLAGLRRIRLRVLVDFLRRETRPRLAAPGRVAYARRVVAHDEDDVVAEVLERAQLAHRYGVPDVQV